MDGLLLFVLAVAAIGFVAFVAAIFYLFRTVKIMWEYSPNMAIAAVLFSPFVHIFFLLMPKVEMDDEEKSAFSMYFLCISAIAIFGILLAIVIPAATQQSQPDSINAQEAAEMHFAAIYQAHPDADEVVESPEFSIWYQSKPEAERRNYERVLNEGTSSEVIHMLTLFKIETGGI